MAAARAVYSRVGRTDPERDVVIRNAGGMATASLRVRDGRWFPVLEGNATFVYRADVDPARARAQPARPRALPRRDPRLRRPDERELPPPSRARHRRRLKPLTAAAARPPTR